MYLNHFGLNEPPFRITPHTDFFYEGANRGATLEALLYAIGHDEGIVKVTGEVGTGKTMLCRVLMERLPANVETIYLANPSLARDEILIAIADELKLGLGSERGTRVLRALQDALIRLYGEGRRVVVLIDEAHAMPRETLEEIRLLSNLEANRHKLLQIVLFGQPELDDELNTVEMRQLKERITHGFRLAPLGQVDVESYIDFRLRAAGYRGPMPFSRAAMREISGASEGLTRRVNILADKSLLAAFAANSHSVGEREVKRAIEDSEFYRPTRRSHRARLAGVLAAGIFAGFGSAWLLLKAGDAPPAPQASVFPPLASTPSSSAAQAPIPQNLETAKPASPVAAASIEKSAPAVAVASPRPPAALSPIDSPKGAIASASNEPASAEGDRVTVPLRGKLTRARFDATQQWLETAPGKHHAIQLLTVKEDDIARMENFLVRASRLVPEDALHVYRVRIDGTQHYRAAFGDFEGPGQAIEAMKELPPLFRSLNPYQRSVERMKSQNRQ